MPDAAAPPAVLEKAMRVVATQRARIDTLETAAAARRAPIAVVGIGCRYPAGVGTPDAFWRFVAAGGVAAAPIPPERGAGRIGAFLPDVARFDAAYFGVPPREARAMDPQQRILLEVTAEALQDACIPATRLAGTPTGVFVGAMTVDWADRAHRGAVDSYTGTGTALGVLSGRISHHFDLTGPSETVSTACSSSLVAVHHAMEALRSGACDAAIAAGVSLALSDAVWAIEEANGMLAPDGRSKPFAAAADGFGRGEGCAVLLLKRLPDALADNDAIHGLLLGSAVRHDGRAAGVMVPNPAAQRAVIRAALAEAGVAAEAIALVEAHGTGTRVGDPIEAAALSAVYGGKRPVAVGAAKANFGHTEGAAGVTGLVRLLLALKAGVAPAQPMDGPATDAIPWGERLTLAAGERLPPGALGAVSAFGFSGTNVHLVAAPPPPRPAPPPAAACLALTLSAPDEDRLLAVAAAFADALETSGEPWPALVAAVHDRDRLAARVTVSAASKAEAAMRLRTAADARHRHRQCPGETAPVHAGTGEPAPVESSDAALPMSAGAGEDAARPLPRYAVHGLPLLPWAPTRFWLDEPAPAAAAAPRPDTGGGLYAAELARFVPRPAPRFAAAFRGDTVLAAEVSAALAAAGIASGDVPGADAVLVLAAPSRLEDAVDAVATEVARATAGGHRLALVCRDDPDGAGAAAFLRSAFVDAPAIAAPIVTLRPGAAPAAIAAALGEAVEREVTVEGEQLLAPRLRTLSETVAPPCLRSDRSYLVTGGLGSVGRALAAWLAARGAGHVILFSRSAPDEAATLADALADPRDAASLAPVLSLRAGGTGVSLARGDVADPEALRQALRGKPPIGGIVHAAGVSGTGRNGREVLAAKVAGTRALRKVFGTERLDLVLLVSSAAVWGGRGLSHYAAANAFMDRAAVDWRAGGCPVVAVQYGGWAGSAMVADEALRRYQESQGFATLPQARMLALTDAAIAADRAAVAAVAVDLDRYATVLAPSGLQRRLGGTEALPAEAPPDRPPPLARALLAAHPLRREAMVLDHVAAVAARLTGHERPLPEDRPLEALGFNSLVAVELADELARDLGIALPAGLAYRNPTLASVARAALDALAPPADEGRETPPPAAALATEIEAAHARLLAQLGAA